MSSLKNRIASVAGIALFAFAAVAARAQSAGPNKLEAIDVQTLSGQQVQLKLRLSGPAPQPLAFTIDKPARIALDLPDTSLALASRRIDVRSGGVDSVLAAEAGGRTRIVIDLDSLVPYTTRVEGNTILVDVGVQPGPAADLAHRRVATAPAAAAPAT
jgi:type IV pilus assembly protein PilQ